MKLYFTPAACSLAAHIALREAGLPFELHQVDLATKKLESGGDFLEISPKGKVPALVLDDGSVLTEVPAIVQYIADLKPDADLAPKSGTFGRHRLQEWLNFVTSELHKNLGQLFRPNLPKETEQVFRNSIAAKFSYLDRHLAQNEYLLNGSFTVADGYAFTIVNWTGFFDIELKPWPNLARFMKRIKARGSVQQAMQAEGLGTE